MKPISRNSKRNYPSAPLVTIILIPIFMCLACCQAYARTLSFLTLGDFHAAVEQVRAGWLDGKPMVGGAPCLAGYVAEYRKRDPCLMWVVTGDMFMGHYLDSLTKGKAMIELLNMIPPDCFEIGNHEFDYGIELLEERAKEAAFPIICANITNKDGTLPFRPYTIKKINGCTVLFIGIICRNLPQIVASGRLGGVEVTDPIEAIVKWSAFHGMEADLTVILSHSGLKDDRWIARHLPPESGADIILGGHSHDLLEKPEKVNGIIICHSGSKGQYLGHLTVEIDGEGKGISGHSWELLPVICDTITPDPKVAVWLKEKTDALAPRMDEVIGELEGEWTGDCDALEWAVADFANDVLAHEMGVDIGVYNWGGIRASFTHPVIRVKDIWNVFPFGNYVVRFRVTGAQIKAILEQQVSFSGEYLSFSNALRYTFDRRRPAGDRVVEAYVNGVPLEMERLYTMATNEFLWGDAQRHLGVSKEAIKSNGEWRECLDLIDREMIIKRIKTLKHIKPSLDGRVKEIK